MGTRIRFPSGNAHPLRSARKAAPLVFSAVLTIALAPPLLLAQDSVSGAQSKSPATLSNATKSAARPGETCIVCGDSVGADDDAYLMDGQRVAVHKQCCEAKLAENSAKYLGHLRPHGSQFMDTMTPSDGTRPRWVWLAIGLYVLSGFVFAALSAYRALNRAIDPLPWFFAGLFLNVFGYLFLLTRPSSIGATSLGALPRGMVKIPATHSPRACPKCRTPNHPAARACVKCGSNLDPLVESEVTRVGLAR